MIVVKYTVYTNLQSKEFHFARHLVQQIIHTYLTNWIIFGPNWCISIHWVVTDHVNKSIALCKIAVSPLLMQWRYCSLALSLGNVPGHLVHHDGSSCWPGTNFPSKYLAQWHYFGGWYTIVSWPKPKQWLLIATIVCLCCWNHVPEYDLSCICIGSLPVSIISWPLFSDIESINSAYGASVIDRASKK